MSRYGALTAPLRCIMRPSPAATARLAILCIRPELIAQTDRKRIVQAMTDLGVRLGRAVDTVVVEIDPAREGAFTTVMLALRRTGADAVIVPDLGHVDGIDGWIRGQAQIITLQGEKVLERARMSRSA